MVPTHPQREPVGPRQESVWDYPRPPAVRAVTAHVRVEHRGIVIADAQQAVQVLETAHAPGYYLPVAAVAMELLQRAARRSTCEYKGVAHYADLVLQDVRVVDAAWWYPDPRPGYEALAGVISFYPQRVDRCLVDGEQVVPLDSPFYGDWPTSQVAGPWKGSPGTEWW